MTPATQTQQLVALQRVMALRNADNLQKLNLLLENMLQAEAGELPPLGAVEARAARLGYEELNAGKGVEYNTVDDALEDIFGPDIMPKKQLG